MLDKLIIFHKGDFCGIKCQQNDFKSSILGSVHHFRGNPYLNRTTILFNMDLSGVDTTYLL